MNQNSDHNSITNFTEKIINASELENLNTEFSKVRYGKKIVLAGGCFDILHYGHVVFLEKAKAAGDILVVLLESDTAIADMKGSMRPIHSQNERGLILAALRSVDLVINLPHPCSNFDYDNFTTLIKPDIIATTKNDPNIIHKKRQAQMVGAKIVEVTKKIRDHSSSKIAEIISADL